MKKIIILISITFILLLGCFETTKAKAAESFSLQNPIETQIEMQDTKEPSSTDSVIALLLNTHISQAINNYFGEFTQYALYDAKVKSITQVDTDFIYRVTIDVPTFHGAHNPPYGLETLTFTIAPSGVTLDSYKHNEQ